MKIKRYFLISGTEEHAVSIEAIIGLFQLEYSGSSEAINTLERWLPQDAIALRCCVVSEQIITITTEVYYWREQKILGCLLRRSSIDKTADLESTIKRVLRLQIYELIAKIAGYKPSPWGILRGIRPTKIVHRLLDNGYTKAEIIKLLSQDYAVSLAKAELVTAIACLQRPHLMPPAAAERLVSVYIGIPYCPSRCLYCSFPAFALPSDKRQVMSFLQALAQDIAAVRSLLNDYGLAVQTVYIGGGTPTSLNDEDFAHVLKLIKEAFVSQETAEFTVEAGRPDSITAAKINAIAGAGVSRVSVNPQTMQQKTLNRIGRNHTVQDIIDVFQNFRRAAIPVINMDVIAGLPGEDEQDITDTMEQIASLRPDNLTIHTLALKRGSLLNASCDKAGLPNEWQTANMLAIAKSYADKLSLVPYYLYRQKYMAGNLENVGYALPGKECLYNIQIMEERQTIIGIGPAAGTKAVIPGSWRLDSCYNAKDVTSYINNLDKYIQTRQQMLSSLFANRRRNV